MRRSARRGGGVKGDGGGSGWRDNSIHVPIS